MKRIAILGGGPSALFVYKRFVERKNADVELSIFEQRGAIGPGMPYSRAGASVEHITNVSGNEIPDFMTDLRQWVAARADKARAFGIDAATFTDYKVVPRLLFGEYLADQFKALQKQANEQDLKTEIYYNTRVVDISWDSALQVASVHTAGGSILPFDFVIVCTGHVWPKQYEGEVKGYFDSPYPPSKLEHVIGHAVAIKGASLTAIDAVRTLGRNNGTFTTGDDGAVTYGSDHADFRITLYSRNGMLPAVRFHLEDSHIPKALLLSKADIASLRESHDNFVPLDVVFDRCFKEAFRDKDPELFKRIAGMRLEEFVDDMMSLRESIEPFALFMAEYIEAEKSIKRKESIYWKEMLASLSFAMNQPAKYFSAEDMQRLQQKLMPLISIVIAFVPQSSCRELIAMYKAGVLTLKAVGADSVVTPNVDGGVTLTFTDEENVDHRESCQTYIDCTGQRHLHYADFPFPTLMEDRYVAPATIRFRDRQAGEAAYNAGNTLVTRGVGDHYFLSVPGIAINDHFQLVDPYGAMHEHIYMLAVPLISGFNPDYSGLDFCEHASHYVAEAISRKLSCF
jgi:hypothetical protein